MDLTKAKLGEQYRIFVDSAGNILATPSRHTLLATVIATKKQGISTLSEVILGWLSSQDHPKDAKTRSQTSSDNDYVPNQALYTYGKAVRRTLPVAIQIMNGLDGFPCKRCTNFFPYALANQDDGTLICWSCRNT